MLLNELLHNIRYTDSSGDLAVAVGNIRFDSRAVEPGDVFVAVRGATADGHQFIDKAIEKGAVAIVAEVLPEITNQGPVFIQVADAAETLGLLAANFYGHPAEEMKLVGVTGTNGKTTTATLLWQLFTQLGYRSGLIGTVENRIGEQVSASTHTTPDAVRLHGLLREMANAGCSHVFMEVSSHAVHRFDFGDGRAVFAGKAEQSIAFGHSVIYRLVGRWWYIGYRGGVGRAWRRIYRRCLAWVGS